MRRTSFLVVPILAAFAVTSAFGAQIGEATTPDGGVFAGACVGTFLSTIPNPGRSYANFAPQGLTCQTNSSVPGGSASASASGSGTINNLYPYANSATATAKPGVLRLGSDSDGSSASAFSDGPNTSLTVPSLAVNNISYFVVPVTFGVSFEFALHANAWSGQISSGPFSGQNQTSVD